MDDVVLGFDNIADYLGSNQKRHLFGSTIGRVSSQISNSKFSIDDITYNLTKNDGNHHYDGSSAKVNMITIAFSQLIYLQW